MQITDSAVANMQNQLNEFLRSVKKMINSDPSETILEKVRVDYLGKNGKISALLKVVGKMPVDQRPLLGKAVNEVKREIQRLLKKSPLSSVQNFSKKNK